MEAALLRTNLPPRPLWCGLEYGPALVVVAPGDTQPRDLPPAWAPLVDSFQIAWCATPGPDAGREAIEDVLESLADRRVRTQVVADAGLAGFAADALVEFRHIVRALVVVGQGELTTPANVRTLRVPGNGLSSPGVVASVLAELGWART